MNREISKSTNNKHNSLMKGKKRCQAGTRTLAVTFTKNLSCDFDYSATAVRRHEILKFMQHVNVDSIMDYWCVGFEYGEEKHHPHLQGYFHLEKQRGFAAIKRMLGDDVHFEFSKGSPESNRRYCRKGLDPQYNPTGYKDAVFMERGELPRQGKRRDIDDIKEMMADGKSMRECIESARSYQAAKHCQLLFSLRKPKMEFKKKEVLWFWGATGTGKSRAAFDLMKARGMEEKAWISGSTLKWFQFYVDEEFVIFDDLRFSSTEFSTLLRLLDGYPFCVEYKGGAVWWSPKVIVITSPVHPRDFSNVAKGEDVAQLLRRIDTIREFTGAPQVEGSVPGALVPMLNGQVSDLGKQEKKEVIEID